MATDAASAELARVQEALRLSEASRRESQTFFEKSFEANPAFMTIARISDGKLIEVNPAFVRGSGYSREEALGRSTLELNLWVRPEQRNDFLAKMQAEGRVRDYVADFRAKSGEVRTMLLNADVIHIDGPPCMVTVAIDITERQRREQVQAATYEISQAVLAGGDLCALFKEMHRIVGGLMPARNFYIALLSPDGSELSFPFFVDEHVPSAPPRKPGNGFSEYVLFTAEPLLATADELVQLLAARGFYREAGPAGGATAGGAAADRREGDRGESRWQDYENSAGVYGGGQAAADVRGGPDGGGGAPAVCGGCAAAGGAAVSRDLRETRWKDCIRRRRTGGS